MIDMYNEPWNTSYDDNKAYSIANDEIKSLADDYKNWVAETYDADTNNLDYDEFLVFCEKIAEDPDVVESYYEYRRDDIVTTIDWNDEFED